MVQTFYFKGFSITKCPKMETYDAYQIKWANQTYQIIVGILTVYFDFPYTFVS